MKRKNEKVLGIISMILCAVLLAGCGTGQEKDAGAEPGVTPNSDATSVLKRSIAALASGTSTLFVLLLAISFTSEILLSGTVCIGSAGTAAGRGSSWRDGEEHCI